MSQNIQQIFVANPAASMVATDLLYLGRSPYNAADDFAITFANFVLSIGTATPTASTIPRWDANINLSSAGFLPGFATTVTAAGTTTLVVGSKQIQEFTGTTTQTVVLPVTSTLVAGKGFQIINNSSGVVTVNSSGGNLIQAMAAGTSLYLTCVLITGTTAASWESAYIVDSGLAGAVLLTPSGNQVITAFGLSVVAGVIASGATGGGFIGQFQAFSTGASLGSMSLIAANNAGNFANALTNASTTAARTWTLPDASGTIALTSSSGGLTPNSVAGTTVSMAGGNAYFLNNAGTTTASLPASGSSTIGDVINVKGASAAPWIIQANTSQVITMGSGSSTSAGTATSAAGTDSIQLVYVAANTWSVDWALSAGITLA